MNELQRVGDIEVSQDLRYEARAFRLRQVLSVVIALVFAAGLLGLLGRSGPLSETSARAGSGLEVDYERFARLQSPTELAITIGAGSGDGGLQRIGLSQAFLEGYRVESLSVEPEQSQVLPDRVVYAFDLRPPARVTVVLEPRELGRQVGVVYGADGSRIEVVQWVWP